jgi:hypothetical protein
LPLREATDTVLPPVVIRVPLGADVPIFSDVALAAIGDDEVGDEDLEILVISTVRSISAASKTIPLLGKKPR